MRLWQLQSRSGRWTECVLTESADGRFQLTVLHEGAVAATEIYQDGAQAQQRARIMNQALVAEGWSPRRAPGAG
jgi:hypothetical protein